ncbi:MAG: hypothetical protein M3Q13_07180 [Pseudomonadota bacterium]|nr:hypothetical protein [Pseudomonadota bacterium]
MDSDTFAVRRGIIAKDYALVPDSLTPRRRSEAVAEAALQLNTLQRQDAGVFWAPAWTSAIRPTTVIARAMRSTPRVCHSSACGAGLQDGSGQHGRHVE